MATYDFVILGGGVAAGYAAQEFGRQGVVAGQVAIVSAEASLPYERPPLSKSFLLGEESQSDLAINPPEFYQDNGIEIWLSNSVTRVDLDERTLHLESGTSLGFKKLLIVTGSRVRKLDLPGADLENILYLRDVSDAKRIRQSAMQAGQAVVIGGSFIGMEVASVLQRLGAATTMVFPETRVWEAFFTPEMSSYFESYYRDRGVEMVPNAKAIEFRGGPAVHRVIMERTNGGDTSRGNARGNSRDTLATDLVVAGVGVKPNVELFRHSGLKLDHGLIVDEYLETAVRGVYAAGDIALFPNRVVGRRTRLEHWDNAVAQSRHAVRAMLGDRTPYVHVPYFFSDVFDLSYEFWGDNSRATQVTHRGDIDSGSFSVWWLQNRQLVAAFVMKRPDEERELAPEWIRDEVSLSAEILADATRPLADAAPANGEKSA